MAMLPVNACPSKPSRHREHFTCRVQIDQGPIGASAKAVSACRGYLDAKSCALVLRWHTCLFVSSSEFVDPFCNIPWDDFYSAAPRVH